MVEKSKKGEEPLKVSSTSATFHHYKPKRSSSEKREGNCHIFANSRWAILPPLLLADCGYLGLFPKMFKKLLHPRIVIDSPVYSSPGSQ
jgi:hypothetical protein